MKGYTFLYDVPCPTVGGGASGAPFTFSGAIFPGTYRVTVAGGLSNLPTVQYVISQALARYVSAGLITGLAVAATQAASTRIDYVVSFRDPRMDGGPLRITGAF